MEMCATAERRETRKAPPRAQTRLEEKPSAIEKTLVPLKRLDAAPRGAADGDGHEEVVAAERREPRDATPPRPELAAMKSAGYER